VKDSERRKEFDGYLDSEETESRKIQRGATRRLILTMSAHGRLLAAGLTVVAIGAGAALVEPRLFGYAIDDAIVPGDWNRLVQLTLLFFVLISIRVSAMIGQAYLFEALGQAVTQDLRVAVFSRLQRLPLALYDKNPAGRLMTRVTNDIVALAEIFSSGFVMMVSNALLVAGILVWLLVLNVRLGLIAISVFPFMAAATVYFSRRLRISYREARSRLSALNAYLAENLMGMKTVHVFNREPVHKARFAKLNQWYNDAQVSTIRTYALLQPTITTAGGISMALLIWFGGRAALFGGIKVGVLVTYFAYALALFRPMRDMADKWNVFLSGLAAAERIFSVLEWPTELTDSATEAKAAPYDLRGDIVFENVWFAYDGERWVLRNVSFSIPAGSRVGIVGHTGSGKTTLISLLMRFYEPQRGRILLDGRDIREYEKRRLRASLAVVQQDAFLFSGSVSENVSLFSGALTARSTAILERSAFDGDRSLSERGGNLSAGERQIVAFARACETGSSIWILDEATANMDSDSEVALQEHLQTASQSKTLVTIAHRLATIRGCDAILVLNKGQLVESGSHSELLSFNGLYARLFRFQQMADRSMASTR
jgi:ATP-binding cassette subfamily B protein